VSRKARYFRCPLAARNYVTDGNWEIGPDAGRQSKGRVELVVTRGNAAELLELLKKRNSLRRSNTRSARKRSAANQSRASCWPVREIGFDRKRGSTTGFRDRYQGANREGGS
jgi:hypothetical protein